MYKRFNESGYDFELDNVISKIKKNNAKLILLQFSDGLKPYAISIVNYLENKFKGKVTFFIWFGSCFGACDTPIGIEKITPKIDLIIQFGHNELMPSY